MKLFTEWMNTIRNPHQSMDQWTWMSDKSTIAETEEFILEKGKELFRDFRLMEVVEENGQVIARIGGSPMVTLFELESMKINPVL